jgi:catechol 2,3-dioxygenase-like lactoylglutathione lyase family enzyme
MPLTQLEHYLVLTDDLDGTRDFYRDALGLREGARKLEEKTPPLLGATSPLK